MPILRRSAAQARAMPMQAAYRPLDEAAQTIAPPPGLHYTTGVVQRAPAATMPPVVQRVPKRRQSDVFAADYSDDDELETISEPAGHEYIGLVSWNVQHFSNHDLESIAENLSKQLELFNTDKWSALFAQFSGFRDDLEKALDAGHEEPAFDGMRDLDGQWRSIRSGLNTYDMFLKDFDAEAFAGQIKKLKRKEWKDEIAHSDSDQSQRLALLELVGGFKDVVRGIGQAKRGFQKMEAILKYSRIFECMGSGLAKRAKILILKLRKLREGMVNKSALESFRKALHSHNIVVHVEEMFEQNQDWLDVIILQEANDPGLLGGKDADYTMHRGPHMKSGGKSGQNEYYPLLIRNGSGVKVEAEYVVATDGTLKKVANDELYPWQKRRSVYRPIVAYLVNKQTASGMQRYLIGVVHTTPEVDGGPAEFNRRAIYKEIVNGLAILKKWAEDKKLPLIVGGDYYLSAEAVVKDPTARDLELFNGVYDPSGEEQDGYAYLDEDDLLDLGKTRQNTARLIRQLKAIQPETEQEEAVIQERLKFLSDAKSDAQILRNIRNLTMKAQVERLGLYLDQTVSGTNPKANPLTRWLDVQIADFFIHNDAITESRVGIVHPEGDMLPLDHEDLRYSRYWQNFSDHFPVGGLYGVGEQGIPFDLGRRGQYSQKAVEQARLSNLHRFAYRALVDEGEPARFSVLTAGQMTALALRELRVQIQMIDARVRIPDSVEGCVALIQRLEAENAEVIAEDERLFVTEPTDFEPDYRAKRSRPVKRPRIRKDAAGPDVGSHAPPGASPKASSHATSSSRADGVPPEASSHATSSSRADAFPPEASSHTTSSSRGDVVPSRHAAASTKHSVGGGAMPAPLLLRPEPSTNRVSQAGQVALLNQIAPGWNVQAPGVPANSAPRGLNRGYMASQIAPKHQALAMPPSLAASTEQARIAPYGLRVLRNIGKSSLCFIYAVLMGLTGQSEPEVDEMVSYIAQEACIRLGWGQEARTRLAWITADGAEAIAAVRVINDVYRINLDVVVVQLTGGSEDGLAVSGRTGQVGGHTVLIRQTGIHFDAYGP